MNLILLFDSDFIDERRVRLTGRRREHVTSVHRATIGDTLTVGVMNGLIGTGVVTSLDPLELDVTLDRDPPPPLPLTLILAVPRPKVLNRVIASAVSMGVKRIHLINAWRVEKSYWKSPRLNALDEPCVLGLEQARDTVMPSITLHRLFRPFIESFTPSGRALVAHPGATIECPRDVRQEITLAIGPEGGFIAQEIESFERAGFTAVSMGPRILRVETAVAALIARMF